MTTHQSILAWKNYRYFGWFAVVVLSSSLIFVSQFYSSMPAWGGTWQGYTLGTIGALQIVWLTLLGVRKRRYRSRMGTVEGWTSAHVYLGASVVIVATLHCAAELASLNVHTMTFWLMLIVVLSGFAGLYAYLHIPESMSQNLGGRFLAHWVAELTEVDRKLAELASTSQTDWSSEILSALQGTAIGGSKRSQLFARDTSVLYSIDAGRLVSNKDQAAMISILSRRIPQARDDEIQSALLNKAFLLFGNRQFLLRRIRKDMQYKAILKAWLYLHIPFTVSFLVALSVHIFVIFYYW